MSETIRYCEIGCTRPTTDGKREKVHAKIGRLCGGCVSRLEKWLTEIPERYALLPEYLLPSADLDANPESKPTKRPTAPVPVRLGALDLLDTRRGRKWSGLVPTDDRRGALGTLLAIANEVRAGRNTSPQYDGHVITEAAVISEGLTWLATQEGIADIYAEIKSLHRELGDAVGQYPPRPVGRSHLVADNTPHDETTCGCAHHHTGAECDLGEPGEDGCREHWARTNACGGALLPVTAGVICHTCGAHWDQGDLRLLGAILKETA